MAQDINKAVEQLKELLNGDNAADNINSLLSMLSNSSKTHSEPSQSEQITNRDPVRENSSQASQGLLGNAESLMKIKSLYDKVTTTSDPRVNLLHALKPYLNPKRISHLDHAIKMVNLTKLSSVANELDIFKF